MKRDYSVVDAVTISSPWGLFDLHNFLDVAKLSLLVDRRSLVVTFRPRASKATGCLGLSFLSIDYLQTSPCLLQIPTGGLAEIGFKKPGDLNLDWLGDEEHATEFDHVVLRFLGDEFIRVHSEVSMFAPMPWVEEA